MIEDTLWVDAEAFQKRREEARAKLDEVASWAGWDKTNGATALIYMSLCQRIRSSTEDEIEEMMLDMQSRIDHLMLKKLETGL